MRFWLAILAVLLAACCHAQIESRLFDGMRWRMIGPFRGGRTVAATGVVGHPGLYYIGVNNGGVWKTDDFGRVWKPIFDDQPTGSIGALAVAPSDPNIVYVGSGEGIQRPDLSTGDGIYKSADAGKTWRHLGLRDGRQIGAILVDPTDPKRVFVAVLGHPYGPNEERGVFRSEDGGETWQKVLYKDPDTGAIALAFDPHNSKTLYADLFASRQAPWENGVWYGPKSGLYKSTDGGDTWTQLTKGLPTRADGLGRIGFGVSASNPNRLYALVEADNGGVFRSDDAGESWQLVNDQQRLWGRGSDFAEIKVDPKDPDTAYIANTSTYRTRDGGKTWEAIKGAPGGDDYHTVCIDPDNTNIILLASDQGATISVNDGRTWSSWYNQPTAQLYHVATDNAWPYWVYSGQQESGSVGISSRGNDGAITFREWHPVGAEEYAYVAPDPLNPDIVYGGKVTRFEKVTGQTQDVSPPQMATGKFRTLRTAPLVFSQADPHSLFFAANVLFKTRDGGHSWQQLSDDLTRLKPAGSGVFPAPARRGVIYSVGPSPRDIDVIWAGTDDGLVHVTTDGGKLWKDVTPKDVDSWSKISQIDAGHFSRETAYIAVNRIRLDDFGPHIYKTHDGGKSWAAIIGGLPPEEPVNTVREDPQRPGLLYAGTEDAVYFSIDDGGHWQSLRLNMPCSSVRDLVVHEDDLVVATHGRSFWILDDVTPLRQAGEQARSKDAFLFKPGVAVRVHWNNNTDTPLPPEEPVGQNPPDGAILDYTLRVPAKSVTLEIWDIKGQLVRRYTDKDKAPNLDPDSLNVPTYWIRPFKPLSNQPGFHRFTWNLHFPSEGQGGGFGLPMTAIEHDTPVETDGPWVAPGEYTVRLTVDGNVSTQPLKVIMDPRTKADAAALARQNQIGLGAYFAAVEARKVLLLVNDLRKQLREKKAGQSGPIATAIDTLDSKLVDLAGASTGRRRRAAGAGLAGLAGELGGLSDTVEAADADPTLGQQESYERLTTRLHSLRQKIEEIQKVDLKQLNQSLQHAGLSPIAP